MHSWVLICADGLGKGEGWGYIDCCYLRAKVRARVRKLRARVRAMVRARVRARA